MTKLVLALAFYLVVAIVSALQKSRERSRRKGGRRLSREAALSPDARRQRQIAAQEIAALKEQGIDVGLEADEWNRQMAEETEALQRHLRSMREDAMAAFSSLPPEKAAPPQAPKTQAPMARAPASPRKRAVAPPAGESHASPIPPPRESPLVKEPPPSVQHAEEHLGPPLEAGDFPVHPSEAALHADAHIAITPAEATPSPDPSPGKRRHPRPAATRLPLPRTASGMRQAILIGEILGVPKSLR